MSIIPFFNCKDIKVPYKFIRKELKIILNNEEEYKQFYEDFAFFFFEKILLYKSFQWLWDYHKNNKSLDRKQEKYLKNTLSRVFRMMPTIKD